MRLDELMTSLLYKMCVMYAQGDQVSKGTVAQTANKAKKYTQRHTLLSATNFVVRAVNRCLWDV